MFGSFMPNFGGRMSKAASMFGNQKQQDQNYAGSNPGQGMGQQMMNMGMGLGNMFGRGRQDMPVKQFPGFGGQSFGQAPQMGGGGFMGNLGNMGMQMGRALAPQSLPFQMQQQMPQQMPMPDYMQGRPPGDLSGAPGRIGDMYRQGKIQTMMPGGFGGFGLM